ncbi:ornithine cyclodeaminase family protein [Rhodococcoides kroppenstedtii]|uniref:ornithine cyclodeaminase family protein n=1 Tax=Rhodococcoides kroppenstedtii TaxID=293050 RepID=UPI003634A79A
MTGSAIEYLDAREMFTRLPPARATAAITDALTGGVDPSSDPARSNVPTTHGHFLLMPTDIGDFAGVKIATVAPQNPLHGHPRIQGLYILFDSATLTPRAILDGPALTTLRTPAVSIAAVRPALELRSTPLRVVIFGGGPQATGHANTLADAMRGRRPIERTTYVVRTPHDHRHLHTPDADVVAAGSDRMRSTIADADVVVCATSAQTPLFDSTDIGSQAIVIAVGSHEPQAREVDSALVSRAQVVVEDVPTALRESGDIVLAARDGAVRATELIPMAAFVTGNVAPDLDRPLFFKSSGMSWEDLVVARAVVSATR